MWVYYFIFVLLSLSALFIGRNRKVALFAFLIFAVLYICKARIGMDYSSYKFYYENMQGFKDISLGGFEIGYNLLSLIFHKIGLPFQIFCMCMSGFVIVYFYETTKKLGLEFGITVLLALYYIFYPTLETLRQEIAIILFFYSLTLLVQEEHKKENSRKYFFINIIGFLFHRTAILAFIYYFFRKSKIMKIGIGVIFVFFAALQPVILDFLQRFQLFYNRYYHYVWYKSVSNEEVSLLSFKLIEYLIAFVSLLIINAKNNHGRDLVKTINVSKRTAEEHLSTIENIALNLIEIGLVIQIFVSSVIGASYRLVYYCDIGILLFYASIHQRIKKSYLKFLYIIVVIIYIGVRLGRIFPFDNDLFIYHFLY